MLETVPKLVETEAPAAERPLTLAEHLEELRRRLTVSFLALLATVGFSFTQVDRMMDYLQRPAAGALTQLAYFHPTEPLTAYIKLAALSGLVLAMPVILWQLWGFIRLGLNRREQALGLVFAGWGSFQFLAGVAFAYFVLLPASLQFLLKIGRNRLEPVISVEAYLSFVTAILGWTGLVFELPVVLFILAKVGVVTPEWLRQQRSYAILILVIVAAVITPTTDPVNLMLMAAPLIVLYECSILVTRFAMPKRR